MTTNINAWDRWLRALIACGLLATAWYARSVWPLAVGIILLWTAIAGWCPLRALLSRILHARSGSRASAPDPLAQGFAAVAQRAVAEVTSGRAALLDVRRDDEWVAGHAPMALHWELSKLEAGQLPDIPKDRPVFVHCAAGARAARAADILMKAGWEHAFNLGGLNDWKAAGGQVVTT